MQLRSTLKLLSNADLDAMGLWSRTTRWRLVRNGMFPPGIRVGRSVRWDLAELEEWLSSQRRGAAFEPVSCSTFYNDPPGAGFEKR